MKTLTSPLHRKMAFVMGVSLLTMAIFAGTAYGYAFQNIYVANNSSATLVNLNQSQPLFRLFIFLFVVILILDVIVAWSIYIFFKDIDESLSLLTAWMRLIYAALLGVSLQNSVMVLQFQTYNPQNEMLIDSALNGFLEMWSLSLIVFGVHLCLLGYLALKTKALPKTLGILALVAGGCYLATNTANLLLEDYQSIRSTVEAILSLPMAAGELGLAVWLLWKGRQNISLA